MSGESGGGDVGEKPVADAAGAPTAAAEATSATSPSRDVPADQRLAEQGQASAPARAGLSADAPEFVPEGLSAEAEAGSGDILSRLPEYQRSFLRGWFQAPNGECVSYYVGRLKSYNNRSGYGFVECPQATALWRTDVFIHKNWVQTHWTIGQPLEFAVQVNSRGQPQACDVKWLPRIQESGQPWPSMRPGAVSLSAASTSVSIGPAVRTDTAREACLTTPPAPGDKAAAAADAADMPGDAAVAPQPAAAGKEESTTAVPAVDARNEAPAKPQEPRRLGVLKSIYTQQGYGFIACEELFQQHNRDVYFDKSQLPQTGFRPGMVLEFTCCLNTRGQPQARSIDWDPIPLVPDRGAAPGAPEKPPASQRSFAPETHERLLKILRLIHNQDFENAVLFAIDLQNAAPPANASNETPDANRDVDFVCFVLDRLGPEKHAVTKIKDFLLMCLLLMLCKMLRHPHTARRCEMLVQWFEALAERIDTTKVEAVGRNYKEVLVQIKSTLDAAFKENQALQDEALAASLNHAMRQLDSKVPNHAMRQLEAKVPEGVRRN